MIRVPAEWEAQECLIVSLPHEKSDWAGYLDEILDSYEDFIRAVARYQKVLLLAPQWASVDRFAAIDGVSVVRVDTNDTWVRDYGPIDVWDGARLKSYDFIFNAWGGKFGFDKDNAVNQTLFKNGVSDAAKTALFATDADTSDSAKTTDATAGSASAKNAASAESAAPTASATAKNGGVLEGDLIPQNLILEGGSVEFNGAGVLLTSEECLLNDNRNGLKKGDLEKILTRLFGLKRVIWLQNGYIIGDDTDSHIDTLARFLDENTIAYAACDDENDPHFGPLKKMEEELLKTGFELVKLPIPTLLTFEGRRLGATYCNFIFINGAIIMPLYGDEAADSAAMSAVGPFAKKSGRAVVGVRAEVFLRQNGSLHCASINRFLGAR